ncbi:MAG: FtsX-like permease family protein [Pseudomonadota bacterium]
MRAVVYALRSFGRELRSGEVLVLLAAVALAVAALTAVGFLTDRISKAVKIQANETLAADLRLRSQDPVPQEWRDLAAEYGLQTADAMSFPSVVFSGEDNALSVVRAVSDAYPLRGALRVTDDFFAEERTVDTVPASGEVWAEGSFLARVGATVGDSLQVGEIDLVVTAILTYRPDQSIGFASMAPTVMINAEDLEATGLVGEGSRVTYRLLVAGSDENVAGFAEAISAVLPDTIRVSSQEESTERVYSAADRADQFLSLTAVISLLLSAVAVAMSARRFAQRRMDTVALMKSLGATQGFVMSVSLVQLALLGVLGVVAGSIVGYAAESFLSSIIRELLQSELPSPGLRPVVLACGSAFILLLGFALPSLIQLRNTPPLRVLRHDEMPPPPSRGLVVGTSLLAVTALLYQSVGDGRMLFIVLGGIIVIAALLYIVGRLMVHWIGSARSGVGVAWRYGLANVARRGRASAVQVVAFGLGITVLLLLTLVRTDLLDGWRKTLDENAPNHFLINIQPQEVDSIASIFADNDVEAPAFTPMVRGRMLAINDVPVNEREYPAERGEWLAKREANLTWLSELNSSSSVSAGEWWTADYNGEPQVSVEDEIAVEMGVGIGDRLKFFIAGREIEGVITNLRKVNWDSFQPNFFIAFSPGALDGLPATFVSSMRLAEDEKPVLLPMLRAHPTVSVIDIGAILAQVRGIIEKASLAVQAVFIFTLAAGIAVLFAAVQSTIDERRFESAMLRALGARKRTVFAGVMAEFAALGLAAGILASAGATILEWIVATQLFELKPTINPWLWLVGVAAGVFVVCVSGYVAARGAVNARPVDVLRGAAA